MKSLKEFLNYIYFRLVKVYYKGDGEEADTASIGVAVFIFSIIFNFLLLLRIIFFKRAPFEGTLRNLTTPFLLVLVFAILHIVTKKYKDYPIKNNEWNSINKNTARLHTVLILIIGFMLYVGIPVLVLGNFWPWNK